MIVSNIRVIPMIAANSAEHGLSCYKSSNSGHQGGPPGFMARFRCTGSIIASCIMQCIAAEWLLCNMHE